MIESKVRSPTADGPAVLLSVVVPTYNDHAALERNLPVLLRYLEKRRASYEVLIVDDGSPLWLEAKRIATQHGCRFLRNPVNRGKGAAVRRGMLEARGRYCFYTDADIPYELDAFERALHYLDVKGFHAVAGDWRLPGSSYHDDMRRLRRLGSHVCSFIVGRFLTGGWHDTQCGFKGFQRDVARDLFSVGQIEGFAFDIELIYVALHRNYDLKRIPVVLRSQDGSSVNLLRDGLGVMRDLARIRWNKLRDRYVHPNGVGMTAPPEVPPKFVVVAGDDQCKQR